ncbi:MAG TPA: hypothetical protein VHZ31_03495 [Solirubrobacteraceae bacterium]|jgi:hypothetical protein|nr:hypothetical protein [Solirubrobacteraceae bacterium]
MTDRPHPSDIDLFFLYDGADDSQRFPWTTFLRLSARLIEATEAMDFPPFSGDGRYLEVQYVREMEQVLGSPRAPELVADLAHHYEGFLSFVQRDELDLLAAFADDAQRKAALSGAARYGDLIHELLVDVLPEERMRFLVI